MRDLKVVHRECKDLIYSSLSLRQITFYIHICLHIPSISLSNWLWEGIKLLSSTHTHTHPNTNPSNHTSQRAGILSS